MPVPGAMKTRNSNIPLVISRLRMDNVGHVIKLINLSKNNFLSQAKMISVSPVMPNLMS